MSDLVRLKNGDYLAFFHDDGRFIRGEGEPGQFYVYQTRSRDGGLTWGAPTFVVTDPDAPATTVERGCGRSRIVRTRLTAATWCPRQAAWKSRT